MPEVLETAVIGGGLTSAVGSTHRIAAHMDGRWRTVAGCFSTRPSVNRESARVWGVAENAVYDDWRRLLDAVAGRVDAVVVLAPTPDHAAMVTAALEAGLAVISEKALATSLAEWRRIDSTVRARNGFLAVTFNYTGYPMLRELRRLIGTGHLGTINQVHVEMPQDGYVRLGAEGKPAVPQTWRLSDPEIPMLHLDLGVHAVHLIEFLTGIVPTRALATNSTFGPHAGVVDNTLAVLATVDTVCQVWFGKSAFGDANGFQVRVFGTQAAARWVQADPEVLAIHRADGVTERITRSYAPMTLANEPRYNRFKAGHPAGFIESFANQYVDLADALLAFRDERSWDNPYVFDSATAGRGLTILAAMNRSANCGTWVDVTLPA